MSRTIPHSNALTNSTGPGDIDIKWFNYPYFKDKDGNANQAAIEEIVDNLMDQLAGSRAVEDHVRSMKGNVIADGPLEDLTEAVLVTIETAILNGTWFLPYDADPDQSEDMKDDVDVYRYSFDEVELHGITCIPSNVDITVGDDGISLFYLWEGREDSETEVAIYHIDINMLNELDGFTHDNLKG